MLKKFCHDQVKILLERMDTHPEEFIKGRKWEDFLPVSHGSPLISPRFKHFTKLEQYLIRQKYESLVIATLRQRAYDGILETLVFKEETNTAERYYSTSNQPVLGTPTIYEATVDVTTGKMTEKITRIKSK
jgi:late competence protein required for DNA uptake (superfamily II DNA/RNA helicase)